MTIHGDDNCWTASHSCVALQFVDEAVLISSCLDGGVPAALS